MAPFRQQRFGLERLRALQQICGGDGPDALLFIGGCDAKGNVFSHLCLRFLFEDVPLQDLRETAHSPGFGFLDEAVVLVTKDSVSLFHDGSGDACALFKQRRALWTELDEWTLSPQQREDVEQGEIAKVQAFRSMILDHLREGDSVGVALNDGMELQDVEYWPLVQSFALENLGGSCFLTMRHQLRDVRDELIKVFHSWDELSLEHVLGKGTRQMCLILEGTRAIIDRGARESAATKRSLLSEADIAEALAIHHEFASVQEENRRREKPLPSPAVPYEAPAGPRVLIGQRTCLLSQNEMPSRKHTAQQHQLRDARAAGRPALATHLIIETSESFSGTKKCCTFFLTAGGAPRRPYTPDEGEEAVEALHLHDLEAEDKYDEDEKEPQAMEDPSASVLLGVYAALVAAFQSCAEHANASQALAQGWKEAVVAAGALEEEIIPTLRRRLREEFDLRGLAGDPIVEASSCNVHAEFISAAGKAYSTITGMHSSRLLVYLRAEVSNLARMGSLAVGETILSGKGIPSRVPRVLTGDRCWPPMSFWPADGREAAATHGLQQSLQLAYRMPPPESNQFWLGPTVASEERSFVALQSSLLPFLRGRVVMHEGGVVFQRGSDAVLALSVLTDIATVSLVRKEDGLLGDTGEEGWFGPWSDSSFLLLGVRRGVLDCHLPVLRSDAPLGSKVDLVAFPVSTSTSLLLALPHWRRIAEGRERSSDADADATGGLLADEGPCRFVQWDHPNLDMVIETSVAQLVATNVAKARAFIDLASSGNDYPIASLSESTKPSTCGEVVAGATPVHVIMTPRPGTGARLLAQRALALESLSHACPIIPVMALPTPLSSRSHATELNQTFAAPDLGQMALDIASAASETVRKIVVAVEAPVSAVEVTEAVRSGIRKAHHRGYGPLFLAGVTAVFPESCFLTRSGESAESADAALCLPAEIRRACVPGFCTQAVILEQKAGPAEEPLLQLLNPLHLPGFVIRTSIRAPSKAVLDAMLETSFFHDDRNCSLRQLYNGFIADEVNREVSAKNLSGTSASPSYCQLGVPVPIRLEYLSLLLRTLFPKARPILPAGETGCAYDVPALAAALPKENDAGCWPFALKLAEAKVLLTAFAEQGRQNLERALGRWDAGSLQGWLGVAGLCVSEEDTGKFWLVSANEQFISIEPTTPPAAGVSEARLCFARKGDFSSTGLAEAVRLCRPYRPQNRPPLKTRDVNKGDRDRILSQAEASQRPLPSGWLSDGYGYVNMLGQRSMRRPDEEELVQEWVDGVNRRRAREEDVAMALQTLLDVQ